MNNKHVRISALVLGVTSLGLAFEANGMPTYEERSAPENSVEFVNYIEEGTVWELLSPVYSVDPETKTLVVNTIKMRHSIEGITEIDGTEYMTVWKSNETDGFEQKYICGYLRYENGKVYERRKVEENYADVLLYDFTLGQFETVNLYYDIYYPDLAATCSEISETLNEGNNYTLMKMEISGEIDTNNPDLGGADLDELGELTDFRNNMTWIRGLGSTEGLFANVIKSSTLDAVYHNGVLIYKPQQSGVENLTSEPSSMIKSDAAYHLNGTPFKDGDTGVCVKNGKKIVIGKQ